MALTVGAAASLLAIAFVECVAWLNAVFLISPRARVQVEGAPWMLTVATLVVPTLGGLAVGLAHRYLSPAGRPLGPTDVIRAVQFRRRLPDIQSGLVSTATAALSLGAGASVGQYGPMVYLGALIGGLAQRVHSRIPNLAGIAVSCGVAAAIATAFNAPIAGLVFAHEIVLRHYATQAFAPVTVASATGYVIANVVFERSPLFLLEFPGVAHGYEFALFAVLGLCVALIAVGFMRLLLRTARVFANSGIRPEVRPAIAGLAVGATALVLPDVLGIGTETLRFTTIEGAFGQTELLVLVVAKIALTALCIGAGFAGGVFSPALLIGSLFGALFWSVVAGLAGVPTSGVAVYAVGGMMAFASAVIGAPLTCILIVFELTRNYDITIAAMVAVVFSNLVAHRIFGRSLYDVQLAQSGLDFSLGRDRARLAQRMVTELVARDAVTVEMDEPLLTVRQRLADSGWHEAFVIDKQERFAGTFAPVILYDCNTVGEALSKPLMMFDETTSIAEAMERLRSFHGDAVPVVERESGRYLGAVAESAVVAAWLDEAAGQRSEENASL